MADPTPPQKPVQPVAKPEPVAKPAPVAAAPKPKSAPKPPDNSFRGMSRRELLKLSPVLLAGAFAIPAFQEKLLDKGVGFSDIAADILFRKHHGVQLYSYKDVVPFEKFPYNGYDVIDPEVDLDAWKLQVSGAVKKPGEYTLAQIMALPKYSQNTR